jgi:ABC-2 type transport system permease protein
MSKIIFILRHEIYSLLSRPSFWFGVLGVPLIGFIIFGTITFINSRQDASEASPADGIVQLFTPEEDLRPQGYVDLSGLIVEYPQGVKLTALINYTNESEARQALDEDFISAYYVIPANYLEIGSITVYTREFNMMQSGGGTGALRRVIEYNLLGRDEQLASAVNNPLPWDRIDTVNLSAAAESPGPAAQERDESVSFFLPYSVMMLFYITIMGAAGMLLNSVTKEKENRVMEILMISVTPHQLLLGKIAGLGIVGLLQVSVWGLSAFTLLRLSGQTFNLQAANQLDPSILAWGVVFFVFGYLVYASLMAGIGALVPNLREASQATTLVIMPLLIPLFLISALIQSPNGTVTTILSIFPLTAPTTMMLRLAATDVPLWQILLSLLLLAITTLLIIRAVAGMFRAQTLLSGQTFNIKRFLFALVGRN